MSDDQAKNLINGVPADYLNVNDRAIHYGDGLFETILYSNNVLYYWQQHYQRLQASSVKLKLNCPDEKVLLDDIVKLIKFNKAKTCAVKIILSRGAGERGYGFTGKSNETRVVSLSAIETDYSSLLSEQLLSGDLCICKQQVSINESLAGLKHLNRLENVLARNEWHNEYIDGLMINANQHIIEGTMSNLFVVKDNELHTPDLTQSGVNGIMRDVIIGLAKKNKLHLSVTDISIDNIFTMDELFISNSLIGIKSVKKLDDRLYEDQTVTNIIFNDLLKTRDNYAQAI